MSERDMLKIRWAPPLRPAVLKRLYDSDAAGLQDVELCDEVGIRLFTRCTTFAQVGANEVECPGCGTVFAVLKDGKSSCPNENCDWHTTWPVYTQSVGNHNAYTGRAVAAYDDFLRAYPNARTYKQKILLIDQLIHSFHVNEKTGQAVKSIASKLLEGNKKEVVKFLDDLSAINPVAKERWRQDMEGTIDRHIIRREMTKKG